MTTKTFDCQTANFLAAVGENMPDIPRGRTPEWIEHPKGVQEALSRAPASSDSLRTQIVVDCDGEPRIPSNLRLEDEGTEHRKMGKITVEKRADGKLYANGVEVVRYLSPNQKNGKYIQGHELRKELADKQILNACILDALLASPHFIPDEWKRDSTTYFWGTIFRRVDGRLYVGCVYWDGLRWGWDYDWLGGGWLANFPAAALAS